MNAPFDALRDLGINIPETLMSPTGYRDGAVASDNELRKKSFLDYASDMPQKVTAGMLSFMGARGIRLFPNAKNIISSAVGGSMLSAGIEYGKTGDITPKSVMSGAMNFSGGYGGAALSYGGMKIADKFGTVSEIKDGFFDIDDDLIPEDKKDAYSKYSEIIKQWSKVGGEYEDILPKIKDIASGAKIDDKWKSNFDKKVEKDVLNLRKSIAIDLQDMKSSGLDGYAKYAAERNVGAIGLFRHLAMSMGEWKGMAAMTAAGLLTGKALQVAGTKAMPLFYASQVGMYAGNKSFIMVTSS